MTILQIYTSPPQGLLLRPGRASSTFLPCWPHVASGASWIWRVSRRHYLARVRLPSRLTALHIAFAGWNLNSVDARHWAAFFGLVPDLRVLDLSGQHQLAHPAPILAGLQAATRLRVLRLNGMLRRCPANAPKLVRAESALVNMRTREGQCTS